MLSRRNVGLDRREGKETPLLSVRSEIASSPLLFRFSDFELDESKRELRHHGAVVPLQPKAFDLLRYLVRNRDRVVSKEELLDSIWCDENVTLWSLTTCVRKVRNALGEKGAELVQTCRGFGVRFVGTCEQRMEGPSGSPADTSTTAQRHERPSLLGRETELARLRQALDDALRGHGSTMLVSGPQGIGKSALVAALREAAQDMGAATLSGAAYEGEGSPTFWPWIEIVRMGLSTFGDSLTTLLPRQNTLSLTQLVPEILSMETPLGVDGDSAQVRFRIYDAVTQYLCRAARLAPLLVVVEDVHWGDDVSVGLMGFLARRIEGERLLLVATLRDSSELANEALEAEIARLASDPVVRTIKLGGLNAQSVNDLVARLLPVPLPPGCVTGILQSTGGVPLFVEQLAAHLSVAASGSADQRKALAAALETVPDASTRIIERNLARLSRLTRDVLAVAAVIGNDFDLDYVARVLHAYTGVALAKARSTAKTAMQEGLQSRIVLAVPERDEVYRFAHGMFRNAVYRMLDGARRSRLHWLTGREGERRLRRGEDEIGEVAEHFVRGIDHGSPRATVDLCLRAAALASQRTDFARASILLEHADRVAQRDEHLPRTRRIEILIALAENLTRAGRIHRAREVAGRAIAGARAARHSVLFARAALSSGQTIEPEAVVDRGRVALLEEVLARLPGSEVGLRIQTIQLLAWERFHEEDRGASRLQLSQEALDLARTAGTKRDLLAALYSQFGTLAAPDGFDRQCALASELVALASEIGTAEECSRAFSQEALVLLQMGRLEAAAARMHEALRQGKLAQSPLAQVRWAAWQCLVANLRGEWAAAEEHVAAAEKLSEFIDETLVEVIPFLRTHSLLVRGMMPPEVLQDGVQRFPQRPEPTIGLTDALLDTGAFERARETIASRFPAGVDDLPWDGRWLTMSLRFGFSCARIGDRTRCEHTYAKLLPYDGRHVVFGVGSAASAYLGTVEWGLGVLAGALGRWAEAEKRLATTTALFREMTARPFLALALYDHAAMLRAQGRSSDRGRTEALIDEAAALADELGLKALQRRIPSIR